MPEGAPSVKQSLDPVVGRLLAVVVVTLVPIFPVSFVSMTTTNRRISIDGTLTISSGGTATLTLTGASFGVTDSITITATEEVLPEVYLQIDKQLAEIATAGATAQAAARSNLGGNERQPHSG